MLVCVWEDRYVRRQDNKISPGRCMCGAGVMMIENGLSRMMCIVDI